jgi:hypothetical protein
MMKKKNPDVQAEDFQGGAVRSDALVLFGASGGRLHLSHRPLPRERADHEYPLFSIREFLSGTDLKPQLHSERPDYAGRGFRRGATRSVLRNRGLPARRRREPHVSGCGDAGDGAA